jgi:hypothetical protein
MNEQTTAPDPAVIDDVIFCITRGSGEMFRTLLKMLYQEGKRFAQTPESVRWQLFLRDQEVFKAASILWSLSNMDSFVLEARDPGIDLDELLSF